MQNGPRYLTETDINTIQLYTSLTAGNSVGGWAPGFNADPRELGYKGITANNREFRWCLIGGTSTLAPGTLLVAPAQATNATGLAIPTSQPSNTALGSGATPNSALSKGSFAFNVTNGATAVTQDEFAGGYVEVLQTSGTNEGPVSYQLRGNSAAAASGAITLYLAEPLAQPEVLVAGTDTVNLRKNTYSNIVTSATAGQPVGVLTVQVPNSSSQQYYAWVQVKGHCVVNADASGVTAFEAVKQSVTTAGDVTVVAAVTDKVVGQALDTVTSGTASVDLCLN